MKKCATCTYIAKCHIEYKDWYGCTKIGNCDLSTNVTAMDDEGGQYAVLLIKDPTKFGCILHNKTQED